MLEIFFTTKDFPLETNIFLTFKLYEQKIFFGYSIVHLPDCFFPLIICSKLKTKLFVIFKFLIIFSLIEAYELLDAGGAYKLGRTSNSSSSSSKMNDDRVKEGKGGEYNDSKEEEKRKKVSLLFNKNRGPVVGV